MNRAFLKTLNGRVRQVTLRAIGDSKAVEAGVA